MLNKFGDVFLSRTPDQAGAAPVPTASSVSQNTTVEAMMPSVLQDSVSISQDTIPVLVPIATTTEQLIPSVELPTSTSANNTPPQVTNNLTEVSNASEDPNKSDVKTFDFQRYLELSTTPVPLEFISTVGPIIEVPIDSPLTQSEVYTLRAYELTGAEGEECPLINVEAKCNGLEISRIQLKIFAHLQKRGLSWNDNYSSELLRLGVLVSPSSSPPRKKLKTDDIHGS
jgi:hypothetical protein